MKIVDIRHLMVSTDRIALQKSQEIVFNYTQNSHTYLSKEFYFDATVIKFFSRHFWVDMHL